MLKHLKTGISFRDTYPKTGLSTPDTRMLRDQRLHTNTPRPLSSAEMLKYSKNGISCRDTRGPVSPCEVLECSETGISSPDNTRILGDRSLHTRYSNAQRPVSPTQRLRGRHLHTRYSETGASTQDTQILKDRLGLHTRYSDPDWSKWIRGCLNCYTEPVLRFGTTQTVLIV